MPRRSAPREPYLRNSDLGKLRRIFKGAVQSESGGILYMLSDIHIDFYVEIYMDVLYMDVLYMHVLRRLFDCGFASVFLFHSGLRWDHNGLGQEQGFILSIPFHQSTCRWRSVCIREGGYSPFSTIEFDVGVKICLFRESRASFLLYSQRNCP